MCVNKVTFVNEHGNKKKEKKRWLVQQFRNECTEQYPVVRKSSLDHFHAFCTVWSTDFTISRGGIGDVEKHVMSMKHVSQAKIYETPTLPTFSGPWRTVLLIR